MAITIHLTNEQAERAIEAIAAVLDVTQDRHVRNALIGMQLQINDAFRKAKRARKEGQGGGA